MTPGTWRLNGYTMIHLLSHLLYVSHSLWQVLSEGEGAPVDDSVLVDGVYVRAHTSQGAARLLHLLGPKPRVIHVRFQFRENVLRNVLLVVEDQVIYQVVLQQQEFAAVPAGMEIKWTV